MSINIPEITKGKHKKHNFGTYDEIMLDDVWTALLESNMEHALGMLQNEKWKENIIDNKEYFKIAEKIAKKIYNEENLNEEDVKAFKAVCLVTAADNKLPKGAVVVATFMYAKKMREIPNRNVGKKPIIEKLYGNAICQLHEEGKSIRSIAKLFNIDKETVNKIIVRRKNSITVQEDASVSALTGGEKPIG